MEFNAKQGNHGNRLKTLCCTRFLNISKQVKKHFTEFALSTIQEYNLNNNDLVVDIGSNTGVLLSTFKKYKLKIVGIDPASNMCKIARTRAIPTINNFFDKDSVHPVDTKKIVSKDQQGDSCSSGAVEDFWRWSLQLGDRRRESSIENAKSYRNRENFHRKP